MKRELRIRLPHLAQLLLVSPRCPSCVDEDGLLPPAQRVRIGAMDGCLKCLLSGNDEGPLWSRPVRQAMKNRPFVEKFPSTAGLPT